MSCSKLLLGNTQSTYHHDSVRHRKLSHMKAVNIMPLRSPVTGGTSHEAGVVCVSCFMCAHQPWLMYL